MPGGPWEGGHTGGVCGEAGVPVVASCTSGRSEGGNSTRPAGKSAVPGPLGVQKGQSATFFACSGAAGTAGDVAA